jgi:hypothetical protein
VRRRAKAIEAEICDIARRAVSAVADKTRAQKRGRLAIGISIGNSQAESRVGDHIMRIASVEGVAREFRVFTEILSAPLTVITGPAGEAQPRDSDTIAALEITHSRTAFEDPSYDFMTGRNRVMDIRQFAVN